jgi:hypothetical protein
MVDFSKKTTGDIAKEFYILKLTGILPLIELQAMSLKDLERLFYLTFITP